MYLDWSQTLSSLGPDFAFMMANEATPPSEYVFNDILPEIKRNSLNVNDATFTVRGTMPGMVGMDSVYPPGGVTEMTTFMEQVIKVAQHVTLTEEVLVELNDMYRAIMLNNASLAPERLAEELLNFTDKVLVQPQLDLGEWLRGQALQFGEIDWTFDGKNVVVNYGVPAGNILSTRTVASTEAYHLAGSLFWADVIAARTLLKGQISAVIAHPTTIESIIGNSANSLYSITGDVSGVMRLVQKSGALDQPNPDNRYQLTMVGHGLEADIWDAANNTYKSVKMIEPGKVIFVGPAAWNRTYRVGMGGTTDPTWDLAVGYTHLGPTVEGGNQPGRWARVFVPQERPWQLQGETAAKLLPVITAPQKIVIATTEMP